MEQRIKIIWLLSIASMLLIGAGQGYWLWNQYQFTNEEYGREVLRQVTATAVIYDSLRVKEPQRLDGKQLVKWYTTNTTWNEKTDSLTGEKITRIILALQLGMQPSDTLPGMIQLTAVPALPEDSVVSVSDSVVLRGNKGQYERLNLMYYANLMRLELTNPFCLQRFDSLLAVRMPEVSFHCRLGTTAADSIYQWEAMLDKGGSRLHPVARVSYPYNPLKRQLVYVEVAIPGHVLLLRMGWQLVGSLLMIALLAVCLLFQIRTILKQRRVDELRRSFVNTMIHELKRPVQTLKMCLAFLGDRSLREDAQATDRVVEDSVDEVDNLSAYLQKLRDMTRASDEQTPLSFRTFDFRPVAEKIIRQQHIPDHKQVTYEMHLGTALMVTADPVHLSNMLSNLLENAIKYSGSSVHIVVTCSVDERNFLLSVADNGIGIPAHEQSRVFDKFYRSASLPDRSVPGIGLGLSYVKLLAEAHHGSVKLSSKPGQGTTVTIIIPQ